MKTGTIAALLINALLCDTIKFGVLETDQNLVHICEIAVKDAQDANQCTAETIQILSAPACLLNSIAKGTVNAAIFHFKRQVQAFLDPSCDDEMLEVARLAYFWNSPVVVRNAQNPSISDQNMYPTVIQYALTSAAGLAYAIKHLADYLNITSVVLVSSDSRDYDRFAVVAGMKKIIQQENLLNIEKYIKIDEALWKDMQSTAQSLKTPAPMVVIGYDFDNLEIMLRRLRIASLSSDHYLVILVCEQFSDTCTSAIKNTVVNAKIVVLAPVFQDSRTATNVFSKRLNFVIKPMELEKYIIMYDACYGFCFGTLHASVQNGTAFAQFMQNQQFTDVFGNVTMDAGARRLQNYSFQWLPSKNDEFQTLMNLPMVRAPCTSQIKCFTLEMRVIDNEFWASYKNITINECVYLGGCRKYLMIIIGFVPSTCVLLAIIGLYLYRRKKHMDVYRLTWKVSKENLKVIETKQSKGRAVSDNLSNKRRVIDSYAMVGTSKAEFMCFKQQKRIPWSKVQLKFLYELKSLSHDNLTNFIGICYNDLDRFYVLHALIERASLEDFIYDHEFNVDNTFKSAFIKDILKGLQYLHKSPIGYHGMLSLKTCLIDANWVLKMTHFGISSMLNELIEQNYLRTTELIPQQFYTTVAPELLTDVQIGRNYPKGTPTGDVYSFGLMLYSIIYRHGPFDRLELSVKEVLDGVIHRSLRPQADNSDNDPLIALMCQCWNSTPEARPKLRNIHQTIGTVFSSSKGNLVDQMLKMNEKYAQNLERIVAERTSLLIEAQEQTDRLLCEMLPPSIAAQLKAGETIIPRSYESVTVGFCQIVDFGHLMAQCTAEQVIAFLNDAFMTFDEVIARHDAYKVETTGETYMVASGVPSENGGRHIFEVAEIALELREKCLTYEVAAAPDWQLRVRIGFHCGPIAAGVIGLRSPRYCLFGDTVNFASRMQSNCQANQIQMAESTAKILMESSKYQLTKRGIVHVKGKGDVNTYWLNEHIMETLEPVKTPTVTITAANTETSTQMG